jgi:hypothetical protein
MHFLEKTHKTMVFSGESQWFFGFFPSDGIASDATWMYYVKTKKPLV